MPLDPRIPLAAVAGPMVDVGASRMKAAQLADVLQTQQMRQQIFARQQQQQAEQDAIKEAFRSNPDDIRGALPAVKKIDPYYGWKVEGEVAAAENAAADARRKRAAEMSEDQLKKIGVFAGILNSHNSPERYGEIRTALQGLPGYENFADQLPKDYDPGWMAAKIKEAVPFLEQLKTQAEADKPFNVPENSRGFVRDPTVPGGFREIVSAAPDKVDYGVPSGYVDSYKTEKGIPASQPLTTRQVEELQGRIASSRREPDQATSPYVAASGGLTGEAFLSTIPANERELVKQIADYKMDISRVTSLRSDQRQRIASMVAQYDPTFDMSQYSNRVRMRSDFNSGKASANIRSLNTAVGHLGTLQEKADALDNTWSQTWNSLANAVDKGLGGARVVEFGVAANAVEGELASLFKGTGATDQEIKAWREQLNDAQSPAQINGMVQTAIELMHSRLMALDSQWQQGMGKPRDFKIMTDKSRKVLEKLGVDMTQFDDVEAATGAAPAVPPAADQNAPAPALKSHLDTLQWTVGQGFRVKDAAGTDYGVWKKNADGTYTKVSN